MYSVKTKTKNRVITLLFYRDAANIFSVMIAKRLFSFLKNSTKENVKMLRCNKRHNILTEHLYIYIHTYYIYTPIYIYIPKIICIIYYIYNIYLQTNISRHGSLKRSMHLAQHEFIGRRYLCYRGNVYNMNVVHTYVIIHDHLPRWPITMTYGLRQGEGFLVSSINPAMFCACGASQSDTTWQIVALKLSTVDVRLIQQILHSWDDI